MYIYVHVHVHVPHEIYHGSHVDHISVVSGKYLSSRRLRPCEPGAILLCLLCKPTLVVDVRIVPGTSVSRTHFIFTFNTSTLILQTQTCFLCTLYHLNSRDVETRPVGCSPQHLSLVLHVHHTTAQNRILLVRYRFF